MAVVCGTVGKAVDSDTRKPQIESSHQQFYLLRTVLKLYQTGERERKNRITHLENNHPK